MSPRTIASRIALLALAGSVWLLVSSPLEAQPREVVAAALSDWPPYYELGPDGQPDGFGVETMRAVAQRANLSVRFRIYDDFVAAVEGLRQGEVDVIPSFGITADREEEFDFSSPLETFDLVLFVRSDTSGVVTLEDLHGREVGAVESNVGVQVVEADPELRPVIYDDARTALYELLAGRVDGLVYPRPVLLSLVHSAKLDDAIEAVGPSLLEVKRGIAVRHGDPLLAELEPAVTAFAESEEYAEIYRRWFAPPPPLWTVGRVLGVAGMVLLLLFLLFLSQRKRWYRRVTDAVRRRQRAERARQASEGRYQRLLNQASDGIFLADSEGRFIEVNPRGCEMSGYTREEILDKRIPDLLAPGELERNPLRLGELEVGKVILTERRFHRKDGSVFPGEISATILEDGSYQGILRDVSERHVAADAIRRRDAQLQQTQKMEAIGRLAGGVAHDFNNLLTVILGNGAVLGMKLAAVNRPLLDEILDAAERAADLTRQLLAYSRKQVVQPEPIDVRSVLSDVRRMLERIIGEDVTFTVDTSPDPCVVVAGRAQLEQILMNLAVNARDAMPDGGRLDIRCFLEAGEGDEPGWVVLEVSDTGHGMDADTRAHAFEPFYTTKGVGEGTGLGLATVHSIAEQAGGAVTVTSAPGEGATFRIVLPRCVRDVPERGDTAHRRRRSPPDHRVVLVVEDEDGVRRLVVRSLELHGFVVTPAKDPKEALALCEDGLDPDLLITDVVMPGMGGVELAERIGKHCPGLPVLFISGYARDSLSDALAPEDRAFIAKPFTHDQLIEKVSTVLGEPPASEAEPPAPVDPVAAL